MKKTPDLMKISGTGDRRMKWYGFILVVLLISLFSVQCVSSSQTTEQTTARATFVVR
jgi:hypothetical protein